MKELLQYLWRLERSRAGEQWRLRIVVFTFLVIVAFATTLFSSLGFPYGVFIATSLIITHRSLSADHASGFADEITLSALPDAALAFARLVQLALSTFFIQLSAFIVGAGTVLVCEGFGGRVTMWRYTYLFHHLFIEVCVILVSSFVAPAVYLAFQASPLARWINFCRALSIGLIMLLGFIVYENRGELDLFMYRYRKVPITAQLREYLWYTSLASFGFGAPAWLYLMIRYRKLYQIERW